SIGFGLQARLAFGLSSSGPSLTPIKDALADSKLEVAAWRTALICTELLHSQAALKRYQPQSNSEVEDTVAPLQRTVAAMIAKGQGFLWIHRRKDELPEKVREQLELKQGSASGLNLEATIANLHL